jgi:hypothetical protein
MIVLLSITELEAISYRVHIAVESFLQQLKEGRVTKKIDKSH